jgi:hypothetical protein
MVVDLNPGQYGCEASELIVFGGTLYFSADDSYNPGLSGLQPAVFAMAAAPEVTLVLSIRPGGGGGFVLTLANSDGSPVTEGQLAGVRIVKSQDLALPVDQWQTVSEPLVINNGIVEILPAGTAGVARCFYRAIIGE